MKFAQPIMLNLLWIVILIIPLLYYSLKRRDRLMESFIQKDLLDDVAQNFDRSKLKKKGVFIVLIFTLSVIALARPQWGFEWQEVKRQGIDIIIVVDTSKSMLTQDVKPTRLERTKLAVKDLLKKLTGDRVGLIAFSGDAFTVCPLTNDYNGFLLSLNDLNVSTIPRGGTNLSSAIREAIKGYDKTPSQYKAIVIITDGDDLEGDPVALAQKAKGEDIKIYTIGIGTTEGELIQFRNDRGEMEFLKDNAGNFVKSRLNENLLQQIALTTGGVYVKASGINFGLDLIYDQELSKLEKREIESKMERRFYERFQFPLGVALLFLVLDICTNTRRKIIKE